MENPISRIQQASGNDGQSVDVYQILFWIVIALLCALFLCCSSSLLLTGTTLFGFNFLGAMMPRGG